MQNPSMHAPRRTLAAACCLLAATFAAPLIAEKPQSANIAAESLITKAAAYVTEYRERLTYLMATERYKQTLSGGLTQYDMEESLASDVYFVYVPSDKVWMAIRDVEVVDGKALKERENVRAILNSGQTGAARALKDKNAKYNLGTIMRNFNEPTLALHVLDDDHRPHFSFTKQTSSRGRTTFSFAENSAPTLIINTDGKPAFSRGELTIDDATGRVERSVLRVKLGSVDAAMTTTFRADDKLKMWVPARFDESYVEDSRRPQKVTGRADYSNFTRFDVEVRIK